MPTRTEKCVSTAILGWLNICDTSPRRFRNLLISWSVKTDPFDELSVFPPVINRSTTRVICRPVFRRPIKFAYSCHMCLPRLKVRLNWVLQPTQVALVQGRVKKMFPLLPHETFVLRDDSDIHRTTDCLTWSCHFFFKRL